MEKEALVIEEHISSGNIEYVLDRYDPKAFVYFNMGTVTEITPEELETIKEKTRAEFAPVKTFTLKKCDYFDVSKTHSIWYDVTLNDGSRKESLITLFKDSRNNIGIAMIGIHDPLESRNGKPSTNRRKFH